MPQVKAKAEFGLELDDAIILLMGARIKGWANTPTEIQGITRIEKLMFLLGKETEAMTWLKDGFEFEAAPFGPFSARLYQTVDTLLAAQLIKERNTLTSQNIDGWEAENLIGIEDSSFLMRNFSLTQRGERYYDVLIEDIDKKTLAEISLFKNQFAFLPLRQIIRYVYIMYPEYTVIATK